MPTEKNHAYGGGLAGRLAGGAGAAGGLAGGKGGLAATACDRSMTGGEMAGPVPLTAPLREFCAENMTGVRAAINAGVGVGVFKSYDVVKDWVKFSNYEQPNSEAHAKYEQYYAIYGRLYGELKDEYQALAKATGYR